MNKRVAVLGEAIIDMIAQDDGTYRPVLGGSPFNVARSFAKQGLNSHYLAPISEDHFGAQILSVCHHDGIVIPEHHLSVLPTSLALVYKDAQGIPDYSLYRQGVADLDITADTLLQVLPEKIELFHSGSLVLVPEMTQVLIPTLELLKARGVTISMDVNVRKGVVKDHQAYMHSIWQCLRYADIIKVSDEDMALMGLTGDPMSHAETFLSAMDNGLLLLTLGEKGAVLKSQDWHIEQAAVVPQVMIDTVGAGDTFFAGFLSELLHTSSSSQTLNQGVNQAIVAQALNYGAMASALNIEKEGCQPPSRERVLHAILERKSA